MLELHGKKHRFYIGLIVAFALGAFMTVSDASVGLGAEACRVTNVTRNTTGSNFKAMVRAALDGDDLRVRGVCEGGTPITRDLTITGVGIKPALTGHGRYRVLTVAREATVTLQDVSIKRGRAKSGGGIYNLGTLQLVRVTVRRNGAGYGGGIYNAGTMTLVDSRVARNFGSEFGGGINAEGITRLLNSVVAYNTSPDGAGIVYADGTLLLWHSIVKRNSDGGGIEAWNDDCELTCAQEVRLEASHVVSNTGGGVIVLGSTLTIRNGSTITGNSSSGHGGGVYLGQAPYADDYYGDVSIDASSSVTGNRPDDCWDAETQTACLV